MSKYYDCPVCGGRIHENYYLPGFSKCFNCVELVRELRFDFGRKVFCLRLIYGGIDGLNKD